MAVCIALALVLINSIESLIIVFDKCPRRWSLYCCMLYRVRASLPSVETAKTLPTSSSEVMYPVWCLSQAMLLLPRDLVHQLTVSKCIS
ncbi:hypothetical protein LZ32DRAFT_89621 [Colletotrichum eremochloae]|nr:hypothetical protein LZ32DRAFT_89621 [Colletotrichum eremochloae]